MNRTMTADEVKFAMRVIGLRGTRLKATKNKWHSRMRGIPDVVMTLQAKGHMDIMYDAPADHWGLPPWALTAQGIQQLKQQIGEFHF